MADDGTTSTKGSNGPVQIDLDSSNNGDGDGENLYTLLRSFVYGVVNPNDASPANTAVLNRIRYNVKKHAPKLRGASSNSARDLHRWTRKGGALRALFVISIGTIILLSLTGLLVFTFFLLIATLNAVIISLLMSMAAAGGFLAIFFTCLAAIYFGALSVSFIVISITTISTVIAVIIATGWAAFFWIVWITARKSFDLAKQSVGMTTTAISAYSTARRVRHHHD